MTAYDWDAPVYDDIAAEHHDEWHDAYQQGRADMVRDYLDQADPDEAAEYLRDRADRARVANLRRQYRARDPWEGIG